MSNHLTSLAYKVDVGSLLRKSVLVLLSDKASDDGSGIWASKQTMADELCCSKQAIIKTMQDFQNEGLLVETGRKQHPNGYTITYALQVAVVEALPKVKRWADNQSTTLTSQSRLPVNGSDEGGQPGLPKPSRTPRKKGSKDPSYMRGENLPEDFPVEPFMALVRARKSLRNVAFTEDAARGIILKCQKLEAEGYDIAKLLWLAVDQGWRTVFPRDDCKASAKRNSLTPDDHLKQAEFWDSVGRSDEAAECRRKAAVPIGTMVKQMADRAGVPAR